MLVEMYIGVLFIPPKKDFEDLKIYIYIYNIYYIYICIIYIYIYLGSNMNESVII